MKSVEYILEIVSPYLVRGAENQENSLSELRPPTFRGLMRFWLRAVAGGVIGDSDPGVLSTLETAIFGSTDSGSPIQVRIAQKKIESTPAFILPHKSKGRRSAGSVGQEFCLKLSAPLPVKEVVWQAAKASLELAVTFGCFGVRARRGYGSLRFKGKQEYSSCESWQKDVVHVATKSLDAIISLAKDLGIPVISLPPGPGSFPSISKLATVQLGKYEYPASSTAITEFMKHVPDLDWLGFSHQGSDQRQASPAWVKPVKIGKMIRMQYVVLPSNFTGSDYKALGEFLSRDCEIDLKIGGWNS